MHMSYRATTYLTLQVNQSHLLCLRLRDWGGNRVTFNVRVLSIMLSKHDEWIRKSVCIYRFAITLPVFLLLVLVFEVEWRRTWLTTSRETFAGWKQIMRPFPDGSKKTALQNKDVKYRMKHIIELHDELKVIISNARGKIYFYSNH